MRPISRITILFLAAVLCGLLTGAAAADDASYSSPGLSHGPHCTVPKLIGKTLPETRRAFRYFHTWCRLGKISGKRRGTVVVRQSPKPGAIRPTNTLINVTLRPRG